jgi:pimeloyl-ACP methyl ester carboxylesterase
MPGPPTVVLIHGAFADESSWSAVVSELEPDGVAIATPPNPLLGLREDTASVVAAVAEIDGPVLLVGHSYGGAVISVASAQADNVVGLVYVAAFIPERSEALGSINTRYPGTPLVSALIPRRVVNEDTGLERLEVTIDPARFADVFAADVDPEVATRMAEAQKGTSDNCFMEPAGDVGWGSLPVWAVVAGADRAINPSAERAMAKRADATITEIDGASHAVAVSHAKEVADVIRSALESVS